MSDDDEYAHENAVKAFIETAGDPGINDRALSEACYSVSELGLLSNGESVDAATAIQCWKIVEAVKKNGFPSELRM